MLAAGTRALVVVLMLAPPRSRGFAGIAIKAVQNGLRISHRVFSASNISTSSTIIELAPHRRLTKPADGPISPTAQCFPPALVLRRKAPNHKILQRIHA